MEINAQVIIEDLLEQLKQMTLQLAVARGTIAQYQALLAASSADEEIVKKTKN